MLTITITPETIKELHSDIYGEDENFVELTLEEAAQFITDREDAIRENIDNMLWELISEEETFWSEDSEWSDDDVSDDIEEN